MLRVSLSRAHNHAFSEKNKASWRNICRPPDKLYGLSKHAPKRKARAWLRLAEAHATKQNIVASTYDNLEGSRHNFSRVLGPYHSTASYRALILVGVFNHRHIHQRRWPNQRVIAKHSWSCPNKPFLCKPIDTQLKHTPETMRLGTVLRLVVLCCNASVNIRVSPWRCAFVSVPLPWAANAPFRFQCTFW